MRAGIAAGLLAVSIAALAQAAAGGPVYKCSLPEGKVEFRDSPCPGNAGAKIEVKPNTVTPIDQTSDRWLGNQISERAAMRADEEDRAARQRAAAASSRTAELESADSGTLQYYYPAYWQRHSTPRFRTAEPPAPRTLPATPSKLRNDK